MDSALIKFQNIRAHVHNFDLILFFLIMCFIFEVDELFTELAVDLKVGKKGTFKCVAIGEIYFCFALLFSLLEIKTASKKKNDNNKTLELSSLLVFAGAKQSI